MPRIISENEVTGALQATKPSTEAYRDGYDRIFGKKNKQPCDMGEMCLDCQPRGENGECPDQEQKASQ